MPGRLRHYLVRQVRSVLAEGADGTPAPAPAPGDGLFPPGSVVRAVHGDVTAMMVGGISALLMQMLHPAVLAGVWDHSRFRDDMGARLRRTAQFIAITTYGSRSDAERAMAKVRAIHAQVNGTLPDGTPYRAADPALLTWVHVTETMAFLDAWMRFARPGLPPAAQDDYLGQMARIAHGLGATDVPRSRTAALAYIRAMRLQLAASDRSREVARLVLAPAGAAPGALPLSLMQQAAIDLLPPWARAMHGLRASRLARPLVMGGTLALAQTLRWAGNAPPPPAPHRDPGTIS